MQQPTQVESFVVVAATGSCGAVLGAGTGELGHGAGWTFVVIGALLLAVAGTLPFITACIRRRRAARAAGPDGCTCAEIVSAAMKHGAEVHV